jgi:hypothetical protein
MVDGGRVENASQQRDEILGLPQHLAALVGALKGPPDLGRIQDKYLAYPDRDEASGAAFA